MLSYSAPIGTPISNTKVYILDKYLQPLPEGITGEIYIGGVGLARGYLNRPKLTAEKFIDNPFGEGKLYKTGDLARYLPDGNIAFIGRVDHQVKIRGFRIELGEIESVLRKHPQIAEVVVIAREDRPGDKNLVAYFVEKNSSLTSTELRQFLKEKLPDYMIPSAFVSLPALPLNPNGKIDRLALPAPDSFHLDDNLSLIAPRTDTERKLAEIWTEVLGLTQVSVQDNFFDLGGHSLLATQVISRINSSFDLELELPLTIIFEKPILEELAEHLDLLSWVGTSTESFSEESLLSENISGTL
jgi:hypothetical protein